MNETGIAPVEPLAALAEAEALALLGTQAVGRLVVTRWALPAVAPVNFVLCGGAIWIWRASASSMWQAVRGSVVAFEVDELDAGTRNGWSVVVLGVAELVTWPQEIERARWYGLEPWIPGRREYLLKIPLKLVSGRRIVPGDPDGGAFEGLSGESPLAYAPGGR
jgi:nitroimidazol reductase NimA-like FMN-containing flavoprotein (pyridoxamine 5'-phosphate oxidase superfamily)